MAQDMIGRTVEWEAAGRGRGKILRGVVVAYVPPGKTNEEALAELEAAGQVVVRAKYIRFNKATHRTPRFIVLVDVVSKRIKGIRYIYAPNVKECALG
jgi:hypothetical protein